MIIFTAIRSPDTTLLASRVQVIVFDVFLVGETVAPNMEDEVLVLLLMC